jgi:hypothetical protein
MVGTTGCNNRFFRMKNDLKHATIILICARKSKVPKNTYIVDTAFVARQKVKDFGTCGIPNSDMSTNRGGKLTIKRIHAHSNLTYRRNRR